MQDKKALQKLRLDHEKAVLDMQRKLDGAKVAVLAKHEAVKTAASSQASSAAGPLPGQPPPVAPAGSPGPTPAAGQAAASSGGAAKPAGRKVEELHSAAEAAIEELRAKRLRAEAATAAPAAAASADVEMPCS